MGYLPAACLDHHKQEEVFEQLAIAVYPTKGCSLAGPC